MNSKLKLAAYAAALAVFIIAAYFLYHYLTEYAPQSQVPQASPAATGSVKNTAKDFTVLDSGGKEVKLSDFFGQPIVLNFWASWCPPCRSEMPHFETAYQTYGDRVVFLMVDLTDGQRETAAGARSFVEQNGYTFPIYFDTTQDAASIYKVSSIPTTVLIGRDGSIVKRYTGAMDKNALDAAINMITQ